MKAIWKNSVIAESEDTLVVEGNHYFPRAAVNAKLIKPSDHTSICPWKGTASYYHIQLGGELNENAAWYYADPKPAAAEIKDRIAFWRGVKVTE